MELDDNKLTKYWTFIVEILHLFQLCTNSKTWHCQTNLFVWKIETVVHVQVVDSGDRSVEILAKPKLNVYTWQNNKESKYTWWHNLKKDMMETIQAENCTNKYWKKSSQN